MPKLYSLPAPILTQIQKNELALMAKRVLEISEIVSEPLKRMACAFELSEFTNIVEGEIGDQSMKEEKTAILSHKSLSHYPIPRITPPDFV